MSNTKNTGGPAFPATMEQLSQSIEGMTLRDYFAAKAMQGLLSDPQRDGSFLEYAEDAYRFADAMINARDL